MTAKCDDSGNVPNNPVPAGCGSGECRSPLPRSGKTLPGIAKDCSWSFVRLTAVLLVVGLCALPSVQGQTNYENYTFITLAGPPESPGWYDGPGSAARFNNPFGIAVDAATNVYVADNVNHTIRKISPSGVVTTLAGSANRPGTNDGVGAAAQFNGPRGLALDTNNNLYVADTSNHTIRKITPTGLVTTFAGSPTLSDTNNGVGSAARFSYPNGVAVDTNNNVYVADTANHTIRKITPAGAVSDFAGLAAVSGTNNGTGPAARFNTPFGVGVGTNSHVYVVDSYNHTIRRITPAGAVTTLAGLATVSGTNNGTGTAARFNNPTDLVADRGGNIFVADYVNHAIRKVTSAGVVTSVAGMLGVYGYTNATGTAARFNAPAGVGLDGGTNLFVADLGNHVVRKVTPAAVVTTVAGTYGGPGATDGYATNALFNYPAGVAVDGNTNVYVADYSNQTIRKISPTGVVTNFAGSPGLVGTNNGTGSAARFASPAGIAVDTNGTIYVADTGNQTIRKITPAGVVTLFAGLAQQAGTNNGTGTGARFHFPYAVAVGTNSTLYVVDYGSQLVRKITPAGVVTTLAGSAYVTGTNDGIGAAAEFNFPAGIAADSTGNVYVADNGNQTIRKITAAGVVTTLAGAPAEFGFADGVGGAARFHSPFGIAVDATGNIFVADFNNLLIRKVTPAGAVTTLAGLPGAEAFADGTGATARFNSPEGIALGPGGVLYVADSGNQAIRKGYPAPTDVAVVDLPLDNPGVTRQLDVANLTTTSWSWSFVRYPAPAVAQLSSTTNRNPTLTPDLADTYTVRFRGTNSLGRLSIGLLELTGIGSIEPRIRQIQTAGANVVLTGNGGAPGAPYSVLKSSNVGLPVGSWSVLPGSQFDNNGGFTFTNGPGGSPAFYQLRVP